MRPRDVFYSLSTGGLTKMSATPPGDETQRRRNLDERSWTPATDALFTTLLFA